MHGVFGKECIDLTYGAVNPVPQVVMIPKQIAAAMNWQRRRILLWNGQAKRRGDQSSRRSEKYCNLTDRWASWASLYGTEPVQLFLCTFSNNFYSYSFIIIKLNLPILPNTQKPHGC